MGDLEFIQRPSGSSGGGGVTDGDKGDIVVSSSGNVWTLDASGVSAGTYTSVTVDSKGRVTNGSNPGGGGGGDMFTMSLSPSLVTITGTETLTTSDFGILFRYTNTSGSFQYVELPDPSSNANDVLAFTLDSSSNAHIELDGLGFWTIDGEALLSLAPGSFVVLVSDGSNYYSLTKQLATNVERTNNTAQSITANSTNLFYVTEDHDPMGAYIGGQTSVGPGRYQVSASCEFNAAVSDGALYINGQNSGKSYYGTSSSGTILSVSFSIRVPSGESFRIRSTVGGTRTTNPQQNRLSVTYLGPA